VSAAPKRSLTHKTLHTFATLLFGQGSSVAAGIATAHAFGPAGKGVLSLATILLTFAVTSADGVRDAVAFQIGREGRDARAVWGTALRAVALAGFAGLLAFATLWYLKPAQPAFLYVALAFPFAVYVQAVGVLYLLRDHVERINVKNAATIGGGGSLLTLALVVIFHAPLAVVLGAWSATFLVAAVWSSIGVRELLGGTPLLRAAGLLREQLTFAAKSALSSNVTFLALRVDVFIVSAVLSPATLGVYTLALATGEVMWGVSRSIFWSTSGRVAMLDAAASAALTARAVRSVVAFQLAGGALLFAVGPWLIAAIYGSRFAAAGDVLRILLPGMIFYSADGMLSYFISVRAGRPGLLLGLECVTLGLCAGITLLAVRPFGMYGAAVADTVAYLASYAIKIGFFTRLSGTPLAEVLLPRYADVPTALRGRLARAFGTSSSTRLP
jgi:O-antigen/teichoic acid export membrane protein